MHSIKEIFCDHWDEFAIQFKGRIRQVVLEDVRRMLDCGDITKGHLLYECSSCGEKKKVGFTCKSRFCSSCGKIYVDARSENMAKKMLRVKHRHMVFTIAEELRIFFKRERNLLALLPQVANSVLKRIFKKVSKKEEYMPGVATVIHTFGGDLKWNPHVHVIVTEGGMGKITEWKNINYFNYKSLRRSWQKGLLDALLKNVSKKRRELKNIINRLYSEKKEGFYVFADRVIKNSKGAIKYVGRYTGRPAIANSRIVSYDGEQVTYYYNDKETGKRVEITISVFEFIKRVIVHIADRGFQMIRYYGLYANKRKDKPRIMKMLSEKLIEFAEKHKSWRKRIQMSFGHDPLSCPKCKTEMVLIDIVYPVIGSVLSLIHARECAKLEAEIYEYQSMDLELKNHYKCPLVYV